MIVPSRGGVAAEVVLFGPAADHNAEFIRLCYETYLRKPPDAGSQFWLDELNRTNDYFHVTRAFLVSTEYRARFGPA